MTKQERNNIIAQINELTRRIDSIVLNDRSTYMRLNSLYMARCNLYDQLHEYGLPSDNLDIVHTIGGNKI